MVRREVFINKIRELGYCYKDTLKRTFLYRKSGGTHYITVPRADLLDDDFIISSLRQAGVTEKEAQSFLSSAKS